MLRVGARQGLSQPGLRLPARLLFSPLRHPPAAAVPVTIPVLVAVAVRESFALAYRGREFCQRLSPLLFRLPTQGGGAVEGV